MAETRASLKEPEPAGLHAPVVRHCHAALCIHNAGGACCAEVVYIGEGGEALCRSFRGAGDWRADRHGTGRVVACGMARCRYNTAGRCHAPAIIIGFRWGIACQTFDPAATRGMVRRAHEL